MSHWYFCLTLILIIFIRLVSNVGGHLYATSAKCTHYGAPLANGVINAKGIVRCPWHGACFDVKTGDIEEAPALDSLLRLKVETDAAGNIYVIADPEALKGKPGLAPLCQSLQHKNTSGVLIIGGGAAAINAAESARKVSSTRIKLQYYLTTQITLQSGFTGPISIYSAEKYPPIDRTKLSKGLIVSEDAVMWRSPSHLKNVLKVDVHLDCVASSVDVEKKNVKFSNGTSSSYDTLVLASGGTPKRLPVPGAKKGELENVFTLREVGDVKTIVNVLGDKKDKDIVIIGSSFIGMEVAIAVSGQEKAQSVKVIGMESVPLENILGSEVGQGLAKAQEKKGIQFYNKSSVQSLNGDSGKVKAVKIKDAEGNEQTLSADVVVLGVGVAPSTQYLQASSGFPSLLKDGSVAVDKHLKVIGLPENANVFACGDIATVPARTQTGSTVRIEHWNVAANHGRAVGQQIASKTSSIFDTLPIFWSALGSQLRYVSDGDSPGFDEVYVDGKPEDLKFAAYYGRKGKVSAVCTMGVDPLMSQSADLMIQGRMPSLDEIRNGKVSFSV